MSVAPSGRSMNLAAFRLEDLTEVVMARRRLGLAEQLEVSNGTDPRRTVSRVFPTAARRLIFDAMSDCTKQSAACGVSLFYVRNTTLAPDLDDIERELKIDFSPLNRLPALRPTRPSTFRRPPCASISMRKSVPFQIRETACGATSERGHWENTEVGNRAAAQILRARGILVERPGTCRQRSDEETGARLSGPTAAFLEKDLPEGIRDQPHPPEQPPDNIGQSACSHRPPARVVAGGRALSIYRRSHRLRFSWLDTQLKYSISCAASWNAFASGA